MVVVSLMATDTLRLIDLSSILRPIHIVSPEETVTLTLDKVRAVSADYPHTGICCDSGRNFRHDIDHSYKAQRPETDATLFHLQAQVCEQLRREGFPVWEKKGFEADDIIATATKLATDAGGAVSIVSADKDLLQLIGDKVFIESPKNGVQVDVQAVVERLGVTPPQILDYLCLVGDGSDNITGAKGIGPMKARQLLNKFGSIAAAYEAIDAGTAPLVPSTMLSLLEFRPRLSTVRELITLRTDVDIPFHEIVAERVPLDALTETELEEDSGMAEETTDQPDAPAASASRDAEPESGASAQPATPTREKDPSAMVTEPSVAVLPAPPPQEWTKQLEPRSMADATKLALYMHQSHLFAGHAMPQATLATVLAGRELGFQAIASLRAFHIVENKQTLAADAMRALVLRSGLAKYFRCTERTAERCTWETWREGNPEAESLTYTIEQGKAAWQKDERAWKQSGWGRHPEDMLSARASSKLARLVYSDILFGLYAPEEIHDEVA